VSGSGIDVRGLTKRYGARSVFEGLSLDVRPGEMVAVLGPSGAGKTTLFRCLTRLVPPDAGEITIAGHPMHRLRGRRLAEARRDIGVVFQQFNLIRRRSALENALAGRLASVPLWRVATHRFSPEDRRDGLRALDRVGLLDHRNQRADRLSGGQQQRVAIARVLVQRARVLLADEPVASLDPENAGAMLGLLREIVRAESLAALCSLHQPHLAEQYCDRVIRLSAGKSLTMYS
jgi:phosphonate transport system ATP-binding protein